MRNIRYILAAAAATGALSAFAWGQKGHDTTAFIAEQRLTHATKAAVDSILGGRSIVYYANWMDNASHTPEYAYTKTWHYKNIDEGLTFEEAPEHPDGNIVKALNEQTAILANPQASPDERELALKMVVHFMGDIHQPMHMGHASDRGGNQWAVKYFGRDANIHSVWDSNLVESAHKWSYTEWEDQINRIDQDTFRAMTANGTPESWGKETAAICKEVYDKTPQDTNLSYDYIAEWTPVVEQQLLRGGVRLADLLNSIFDPTYRGMNALVKK